MYTKLESCPSCNSLKFTNYLICEDYTVTNESFALVKCEKCALVFTNPRPETESLHKYYKSDQYISHTDKGNSIIHKLYKQVRKYTLSKKLDLVSSYLKNGTILDYGCGTGDFLSTCYKSGWKTIGFEPDKEAIELAKRKSNSEFIHAIPLKEQVDIITAWHVIEHVEELKDTIKKLKKSLKQGGYMFVALPNHKSLDAEIYKSHWAAYDVPRHLYHFTQSSFEYLIKEHKLTLIDVKPMIFDSYYVSLLSEKYKTGSPNYIKAFSNGLKSNKSASKTGEYSSLIYVLKK